MGRSTRSTNVERFDDIDRLDLDAFVERVGPAQVVLLGDMTSGTSEFFQLRAHITKRLVEQEGFDVVALETDWPDAEHIDRHIHNKVTPQPVWSRFARWPNWQWRNLEFATFVSQLRALNGARRTREHIKVCGLDIYGMGAAIHAVLGFLDKHDPKAAAIARERYDCMVRWEDGPTGFGQGMPQVPSDCEEQVVSMLTDLLEQRVEKSHSNGDELFDAQQNARLVRNAEAFYRSLYQGHTSSWNLRSTHMAETLQHVLDKRGPDSKAVVWAHNVHVGDSLGSTSIARNKTSLGSLCRSAFEGASYSVGLFTGRGTVMASSAWEAPGEPVALSHPRPDSHGGYLEGLGPARCLMPLADPDARPEGLASRRLERAIGPVYRPHTEHRSHHFESVLPQRYDEIAWLNDTHAVQPVGATLDGPSSY